jgi:hypothetical protein
MFFNEKKRYRVKIKPEDIFLYDFSGGPEKTINAFLDEAKQRFGDRITTKYKFLPV